MHRQARRLTRGAPWNERKNFYSSRGERVSVSRFSCAHLSSIRIILKKVCSEETYEPRLLEYDHWLETKALIAGVRKHGTYKKYMRAPHRTF